MALQTNCCNSCWIGHIDVDHRFVQRFGVTLPADMHSNVESFGDKRVAIKQADLDVVFVEFFLSKG